MPLYYGKYRGVVLDNADPEQMARIRAHVPALAQNSEPGWALPCAPFAGPDAGFVTVPPIGANVWIEFEGGNINFPIWSGCFWGVGELPAEAQVASPDTVQVLKAPGFLFVADRNQQSFRITVSPPLVDTPVELTFDSDGAECTTGDTVLKLSPSEALLSTSECHLEMKPDGISIENSPATIHISGGIVDINDGALEVE